MNDPSENPWKAPAHGVEASELMILRDTSSDVFRGAVADVVRAMRAEPWLVLPALLLFLMHAIPAFYMSLTRGLFGESAGLLLFGVVWFVMPIMVTAADLLAARAYLHWFRTGERLSLAQARPAPSAMRLAIPIILLTIPLSFVAFFVFAKAATKDLEFGRTILITFYAMLRGVHFFHAPLYVDRPDVGVRLYFTGFRAFFVSPLRLVGLALGFVVPTLIIDQLAAFPAARIAAFLMYLPAAALVPGIAARVYDNMASPGVVGTSRELNSAGVDAGAERA
jgi:hypothetical protein